MHEHVARLFQEHDSPTHASCQSVQDMLKLLSKLSSDIRKQAIEYKALVDDVDLNSPPAVIVGELERLHQTLGAMDREVLIISTSARALSTLHVQYERYMKEIKNSAALVEASPAPAPGSPEP